MRLEVQNAGTLRKISQVSLPNFQRAGTTYSATDVPSLLADEGLTLEVADRRGPLLVLGEEARGKGYSVPGVGRVNDVTLANKRAALRLASSSGPSWLLPRGSRRSYHLRRHFSGAAERQIGIKTLNQRRTGVFEHLFFFWLGFSLS